MKWCNARSQKEGLAPCYYIDPFFFTLYKSGAISISNSWVNWSANGYRLPTEAEWEKAARGGRQKRRFPWGGDFSQHIRANYNATTNVYNYDKGPTTGYHPVYTNGPAPCTSPVGSFPANGYGLHDMAGNVMEWCWDFHADASAVYQTDPRGPAAGTNRMLRGGSWMYYAHYMRVASRELGVPPSGKGDGIGFRCARGP